jgi:hypothetical protein
MLAIWLGAHPWGPSLGLSSYPDFVSVSFSFTGSGS